MSELITAHTGGAMRMRLLATVSVFSLLLAASHAKADEAERPTVWIELGGQLERMTNGSEVFAPPFLEKVDPALFHSPLHVQQSLRYSNGAEGKIAFAPAGTNIVVSASARYGRSNGYKADYQRLPATNFPFTPIGYTHPIDNLGFPKHLNGRADKKESYLIVDFHAGKDIGVGLFGSHNASLVSLGVRFAQLTANTKIDFNGVPDLTHRGHEFKYDGIFESHHRYAATLDADRSFRGVGPSLSWDSSARVLGRDDDSAITFDWGVNGALLFGRQKVTAERNITGSHYKSMQKFPKYGAVIQYFGVASSYHHNRPIARSRSVIVPNVGGFAGFSVRYASARLSLGYRADFFFGAMDGGVEARKTYDRNFYGPFAKISVGLGGE